MNPASISVSRILCPTDFSPFSERALKHAMVLARTFDAPLTVLHVIANLSPGMASLYVGAPWLISDEGRIGIDEEMRRFTAPLRQAGLEHSLEIREGEPWREIVAAARAMGASLVVMGTHGRGGLNRFFLGSVAEKLVRSLVCPVLTVCHDEAPGAQGLRTFRRILCATDFSRTSEQAWRLALELARRHDARLSLLHVVEEVPDFPAHRPLVDVDVLRGALERGARERLQKVIDGVAGGEVRATPRVAIGRAHKEILRVATDERTDLIVIGAQGHGILEHLISGSNAQHVIRAAPCPVLTVRLDPEAGRRASVPKPAPASLPAHPGAGLL